jgi:hypothetical protein
MVTLVTVCEHGKGKSRGISIQAWTVPEGSRRLKLPEFQDNRHMKVARLLALRTGPFYPPPPPRKYSWYSFLLEAESTPGPEGLCQ